MFDESVSVEPTGITCTDRYHMPNIQISGKHTIIVILIREIKLTNDINVKIVNKHFNFRHFPKPVFLARKLFGLGFRGHICI